MKTLFLIRHAKSSWDDTALPDKDRPLGDRGRRDAPKMGKRLAKRDVKPDLILSSPARRALTTAEIIAKKLNYKRKDIVVDDRLYAAAVHGLLNVIHGLGDKLERVILFGHKSCAIGNILLGIVGALAASSSGPSLRFDQAACTSKSIPAARSACSRTDSCGDGRAGSPTTTASPTPQPDLRSRMILISATTRASSARVRARLNSLAVDAVFSRFRWQQAKCPAWKPDRTAAGSLPLPAHSGGS